MAHTPTHGRPVSTRLQNAGGSVCRSVSTSTSSLNIVCSPKRSVSASSDDKVEEDHLATAFDVTCRAWIVRRATLARSINTLTCIHRCRIATKSHTPTVGAHILARLSANEYDVLWREVSRWIRHSSHRTQQRPLPTQATTMQSSPCTTATPQCMHESVDGKNPNVDDSEKRVKVPTARRLVSTYSGRTHVTIQCRFSIPSLCIMRQLVGVLLALGASWAVPRSWVHSVLLYVVCSC